MDCGVGVGGASFVRNGRVGVGGMIFVRNGSVGVGRMSFVRNGGVGVGRMSDGGVFGGCGIEAFGGSEIGTFRESGC